MIKDADWVRIVKGTWKPGAVDKPHSHPQMLVYALTDGKGKVMPAEGEAKEIEIKAGMAMPMEAVMSHTFKNTGDSELSLLLIELK